MTRMDLVVRHGFRVDQQVIEDIIANPEREDDGGTGMKIAQGPLTDTHVLRIVYEEQPGTIEVINLYEAPREQYEGNSGA